jgi:hypothetical protein
MTSDEQRWSDAANRVNDHVGREVISPDRAGLVIDEDDPGKLVLAFEDDSSIRWLLRDDDTAFEIRKAAQWAEVSHWRNGRLLERRHLPFTALNLS